MSLRALFPDTDRQDGVRSNLLVKQGIASTEDRRLATTLSKFKIAVDYKLSLTFCNSLFPSQYNNFSAQPLIRQPTHQAISKRIQAAENLDKLGEPVISLSRKVLSLLTGGAVE